MVEMKTVTVRLEDNTVGILYDDTVGIGDLVVVDLQDENGHAISICGIIIEILEN